MSSSGFKTCVSCGSFCEPGTLFCGYCGKQLSISGEDHQTILPEEGQQGRGTRILDETQPAPTIYTPEPTMPVYYPVPPSHRSPNTTKLLVVIGVLVLLLISTVSFGLGQLVKSNSQPTINTTSSSAYKSDTPGAHGQTTPTVALPTPTPTVTTMVPTPTATLPVLATWHIRSRKDRLGLPDHYYSWARNSIEGQGKPVLLAV